MNEADMVKSYTTAIVGVVAVFGVFVVAAAKARTAQELALWLALGMAALLLMARLGMWWAERRLT